MGKLVTPKVYYIGCTALEFSGLTEYLLDSGNGDFLDTIREARESGLSAGECLVSFYAKLCYASLTLDKNKNVTKIRDIPDNLSGTLSSGHGSVWEHVVLNFVIRDCSRVFTHELVRHRVGTAFSQTSGRYVRGDLVDLVFDPILEPVKEDVLALQEIIQRRYVDMVAKMGLDEMKDFDRKKKITSALRRVLPNGQSNEMGFSVNLRELRHMLMVRTSRHAEWEIREVFGQVYRLLNYKFPSLFSDAKEETAEGLLEITGMKTQPY